MELCLDVLGLVAGFGHDEGEIIFVLDLHDLLLDITYEIVEVVLELFWQLLHSSHGDVFFIEDLLDGLP